MKRAIVFLVAAAMVLILTGNTMAGTEAGDKEIQLQGSFSKNTNSENDNEISTSTVQISFNYFLGSNFSIGGTWRGSSSLSEPENGSNSEATQNFLLGRADLYLGSSTSKIMPYIGAQAGQISYTSESEGEKDSDSVATYGFHGGIKIFAGENVSWNLELDRTIYEYEPDGGDTIEQYVDSFFAGFSYYF